ncbi:MAG: hag [Verrucomicrobia bacterium]|nr:hag [Verrucomicrobiota bacterium]
MNVSNTLSGSSATRTQETLGRSLSRLAFNAKLASSPTDTATIGDASTLAAQTSRVKAARTEVQDATSFVQAAAGNLDTITGVVSRLGELAKLAQDPAAKSSDLSSYQDEFKSLQDQLRSIVGGSTAEIGGASDVSPLAAFKGQALFGSDNENGLTVSSGQGAVLTVPGVNLRHGSMLGLISQNEAGTYDSSVADSDLSTTIADALTQLGSSSATMSAALKQLGVASASLDVENQNVNSAVPTVSNLADALAYTTSAKGGLFAQFEAAMRTQGNLSGQSVLKVLED